MPSFTANPLCQLLGIRLPIIQAGMVWVSGWRLASAASNAGCLGLLGAGSMRPELLREHIRKCRQATDQPFGVNIPLLYKHAPELIQVVLEEQVQIVVSSAGNPRLYTARLQEAGIKVLHVCGTAAFTAKAHTAGADAIICEGMEAGGHNSREEITTLCLIPQARQETDKPLVAAGGIASGAAILAVMALGADGAQLGSRFALTQESSAHPAFKQAVIEAGEADTDLALRAVTPVRMLRNALYHQIKAMEQQDASAEALREFMGQGRSRRGIFEGDLAEGELEIGQIAGTLTDIPTVKELIQRLQTEYSAAHTRLHASL
ncbi:MAG: nitronate monooxygenase [Bacteroidetes bacterium]|nr:nitronate monooxygenase [Bacteroidota bacterium]